MSSKNLEIGDKVYLVNTIVGDIYLNEYEIESMDEQNVNLKGIKSIYCNKSEEPYNESRTIEKAYLEIPIEDRINKNLKDIKWLNNKLLNPTNI